jgi:hypothetical protein
VPPTSVWAFKCAPTLQRAISNAGKIADCSFAWWEAASRLATIALYFNGFPDVQTRQLYPNRAIDAALQFANGSKRTDGNEKDRWVDHHKTVPQAVGSQTIRLLCKQDGYEKRDSTPQKKELSLSIKLGL